MKNLIKHIKISVLIFLVISSGIIFTSISVLAADNGGYLNIDGKKYPVYTLQKSRNDNESFVILFLGDGYSANEQDKLLEDISARTKALLDIEPFRSYAGKINIYTVPVISEESGVSILYGTEKNTYFNVGQYGNIVGFTKNGREKATRIKTELENQYLDSGAVIGTIHLVSNSPERFGSSTGALFSFSSLVADCSGGQAAIHETAHSIGRLKDEYKNSEGVNVSKSNNPEEIPWKNLLGFRGVGITQNPEAPNAYVPTVSCMMGTNLHSGKFCEVCKTALISRMNSYDYTQAPDKYYAAPPEITIKRKKTDTSSEYENIPFNNENLQDTAGHNLEFRTIVQNLTDTEKHFKLSLKITDTNGNDKYSVSDEFTVPPLPKYAFDFQYYDAQKSLSVIIENIDSIAYGDKASGQLIDCDTNTVIATDTSYSEPKYKVNIHHKIRNIDGSIQTMPNTYTTSVYITNGTVYSPKPLKQLNGYIYVGNSLDNSGLTVNSENTEIDFYYEKKVLTKTNVSDDGKSFIIRPYNISLGNVVILALYDGEKICEIKTFTYDGNDIKHFTENKYTKAKIMLWNSLNNLCPICPSETI